MYLCAPLKSAVILTEGQLRRCKIQSTWRSFSKTHHYSNANDVDM